MKRTFNYTIPAIISLAVFFSGCSVPSASPPTPSTGGGGGTTPANVQVTLSPSSINPLQTTTVTATVTNSLAQPMPNVNVSFSVINATAGSFTPILAVTNAAGQAVSTFTAANVNVSATIQATITVGTSTIFGSAPIIIGSPPRTPTSVLVSLGTATIVNGGNTTVTATVSDASGGIPNATVTFSVSVVGAGSFTAAALTDAAGQTTVTFTATSPAGDDKRVNITATAGTISNNVTLQIGTPPPPTPASMSVTMNPLSVSISGQTTASVTLRDASGNPAFNNPVALTITIGTGLASFNPMPSAVLTVNLTTDASGVATATIYTGASSGTVTVQATAGALAPANASFLITSSPASIALNVANPNLVNGQTTNITATVLNLLGNPVTDGTQVNFSITSLPPRAGSLSAPAASTVNGIASVTFTADPSLTGGVIIQASAGTLTPVQTIIIVSSAQAGSLQFVSVSPASGVINIGGASAILTFKVLDVNGNPLGNQTVNFQLEVAPAGATLSPLSGSTGNGSTNKGLVTTTLTSGSVAGPVRIQATTIPLGTSTTLFASSGALSIGGGVPSMRFLSTSVQKFNTDGLNCDGVTDQINVYMADRFGNYNILQGTSVSFATAYGAIDTSNVTDASGATSAIWRSQAPRSATGLVAILVQTTGEENFVDNNGNGVYDSGVDTFTAADDLPEPFIDNNRSGVRDPGELYFAWPAGVPGYTLGSYDGPNGVWDANIPIFENVYIWMTGPPNVGPATSHLACCDPAVNPNCLPGAEVTTNIIIPHAGSTVCYLYSSDVNGNSLIGGTSVSMSVSTPNTVAFTTYLGSLVFADHPVNGPEITGFRVTNTATTVPVNVSLSATINWPGKCGQQTVTLPYPGTVTLQ